MDPKKTIRDQRNLRGCGARSNEVSRFDEQKREIFDDGWQIEEEETPTKCEVILDNTKTILARNTSPDIPFDRSINPYRGCEHGCIYCFARPTHCYLGYSAGLDFETKIHAKPNAVALLAKEVRKASYQCRPIAMGTNTDPYQPIEKEHRITRQILEFLLERKHPVSIVTKGALINRDLDILSEMAKFGLVHCFVSLTTLENKLHSQMEPRAMSPHKRLSTITALKNAGIPVGVMAAPMIPRLNDMELEAILEAARHAGAEVAGYILLRLPLEVSPLFREWLGTHYPDRATKVMRHIQDTHEGKDNIAEFGARMRGSGAYAQLLNRRFKLAHQKLGFAEKLPPMRTDLFKPPPSDLRQMELF